MTSVVTFEIGELVEVQPTEKLIKDKIYQLYNKDDVIYIHTNLVTKIMNSIDLGDLPIVIFDDSFKKIKLGIHDRVYHGALVFVPQGFDYDHTLLSIQNYHIKECKFITMYMDINADDWLIPNVN